MDFHEEDDDIIRSSLSQMFLKIGVLKKFRNIHRKTPVLESLFNKVTGLQVCLFIRKRLQHKCFSTCDICELFKNTYFGEHLRIAASSLSTTNFAALFSSKNIQRGNGNF